MADYSIKSYCEDEIRKVQKNMDELLLRTKDVEAELKELCNLIDSYNNKDFFGFKYVPKFVPFEMYSGFWIFLTRYLNHHYQGVNASYAVEICDSEHYLVTVSYFTVYDSAVSPSAASSSLPSLTSSIPVSSNPKL